MNAIEQVIERWRNKRISLMGDAARRGCAKELERLNREVLAPGFEALRRNVTAPDMNQACDHAGDNCPVCAGRAALARWEATNAPKFSRG